MSDIIIRWVPWVASKTTRKVNDLIARVNDRLIINETKSYAPGTLMLIGAKWRREERWMETTLRIGFTDFNSPYNIYESANLSMFFDKDSKGNNDE